MAGVGSAVIYLNNQWQVLGVRLSILTTNGRRLFEQPMAEGKCITVIIFDILFCDSTATEDETLHL